MIVPRSLSEGFSRWIDCVAAVVVLILERFSTARTVQLFEESSGAFSIRSPGEGTASSPGLKRLMIADGAVTGSSGVTDTLKGSRVELVMKPGWFLFCPLELPRRASEFLDGIVRAQIDRLTPWSAGEAVFGWSKPTAIANDRIVVTVAATARTQIQSFVQAISNAGAESVVVLAASLDTPPTVIKILEQRTGAALDQSRVRRLLVAGLAASVLLAAVSIVAAIVMGNSLQAEQDDVSRRIAERNGAIRAGRDAAGDSALTKLERRKYQTATSVIAIEALSQILPDHTYVTEFRIEGDKMQVIGLTRDAPSLIRLIEQSPNFTRATFFAPTTRSPSESRERFHIEARLEPVFSARP